jgi:hypothetical protein
MRLGVLPRMTVEGLQELSLSEAFFLRDNEVRGLQQASRLTRLEVIMGTKNLYFNRAQGLQEATSGMSMLQALSLHNGNADISCSGFVGKLTGLTQYRWAGGHDSYADVEACARIKALRELRLNADPHSCPTAWASGWASSQMSAWHGSMPEGTPGVGPPWT